MRRHEAPILMRKPHTPDMLIKRYFKSVSDAKKKVIKKARK